MDPANTIRGLIFLTAALLVLAFPEQLADWQDRTMERFLGQATDRATREKRLRTNRLTAFIFLVIAACFFAYASWG